MRLSSHSYKLPPLHPISFCPHPSFFTARPILPRRYSRDLSVSRSLRRPYIPEPSHCTLQERYFPRSVATSTLRFSSPRYMRSRAPPCSGSTTTSSFINVRYNFTTNVRIIREYENTTRDSEIPRSNIYSTGLQPVLQQARCFGVSFLGNRLRSSFFFAEKINSQFECTLGYF